MKELDDILKQFEGKPFTQETADEISVALKPYFPDAKVEYDGELFRFNLSINKMPGNWIPSLDTVYGREWQLLHIDSHSTDLGPLKFQSERLRCLKALAWESENSYWRKENERIRLEHFNPGKQENPGWAMKYDPRLDLTGQEKEDRTMKFDVKVDVRCEIKENKNDG